MKSIRLNNKTYSCPESWNEVTLEMQLRIGEYQKEIKEDSFKSLIIISAYCGIPIDELKRLELNELPHALSNLAFINTPIPDKPIIEFDFNGKHYFCGQNLVDMQFQDFMSIETTLSQYSGNTEQALPIILAIMCKQRKADGCFETLDDYDIHSRAKEFRGLPITIVQSLSLFFSTSVTMFTNLSQLSSNPEILKQAMLNRLEEVENILKQSDGKGWLTRCVIGLLRIYTKSIRRRLHKHFTSIVAESSMTN